MSITYKKNSAKGFNAELAKLIEAYNKGTAILNLESMTVRDSDGNDVVLNGTGLLKHKKHYFEEYYQHYFFSLIDNANKLDQSWYNRMKPVLKEQLSQLKNKATQFKVVLNEDERKLRSIEKELMDKVDYVKHQLAEAGTGVLDGAVGGLKSLGNVLLHPQRTARGLAYLATHKQEAWDSAKAALESRPLYYAGRFFGGLGTSVATGATTGFLAGHEQMVTLPATPVTTAITDGVSQYQQTWFAIISVDHHPIPNPDTLALVSQNGHPVLAVIPGTMTITHTINKPVMAAASSVALASQVSAACVDFQTSHEKQDDNTPRVDPILNKIDEEIIKFSRMPATFFGKRSILSDTNIAPAAALTC